MSFTIPGPDAVKLKKRIQEEAFRQGLSMSELIVECIADYFRRGNGKG